MKTLRLTVNVISDDRTRWLVSSKSLAVIVEDLAKGILPRLTTGPVPSIVVTVQPKPVKT